ncbi:MAG: DUF6460 domain-containing protein [Rhodospirillales bacterium]
MADRTRMWLHQSGKQMAHFVKTALTLLILSLVVGLILTTLGIHPSELPGAFASALGDAARLVRCILNWGWQYIVIGASVVIPIWILLYLIRWFRR